MLATEVQVREDSAQGTRCWWVPIGAAAALLREGAPFRAKDPLTVVCPDCGSAVGRNCRRPSGGSISKAHNARRALAEQRGLTPAVK